MNFLNSIREWLADLFKFEKFEFEKVVVKKDVILDIVEFARVNHPREFIMYLEGKVRKKVLLIYALSYQEYVSNKNSATSKFDFPIGMHIVGSVHSHPGSSAKPSRADLKSFSKYGLVHMIIKEPYFKEDIFAYLPDGKLIKFEIVD